MADKWQFRLVGKSHTPIMTIDNAYERKYVANLSKPSTATLVLQKNHPALPYLFGEEDMRIQVWQNNICRMYGPIVSSNFTSAAGAPPTIAVTAADPAWNLLKRLAGRAEKGTTYTAQDKLTTAMNIIAEINARSLTPLATFGDTCGSSGTYTAGPYKPGLTCINDLANGIDGFDWYVEPLLEGTAIGTFRGAALVGSERPGVIFEHGIGLRNVRSLGYLRDLSTMVNDAVHISESGLETSGENPTPVVESSDATAIAAHGRFEEVVEMSGVNNVTLRSEWAEANVRVRKVPRRVLSMTSDIDDGTLRVPRFGTDYWLGDRVFARAFVEGHTLFNGQVRVYAAEVSLDNAGVAEVTPILVDEGE